MNLLPKSFLDDLRARLRLSDVVGKRVKLARSGREFKACCPFHAEKSASFYINDEKGFYHCFGCGAHGDAVGFVMRFENRGFMDAVEELAATAGLPVPKPSAQEMERARGRDRLVSLMEAATKWYAARLHENGDVSEYLAGRGLLPETIAAFRLGYAPAGGGSFMSAMQAAGYTAHELLETGLARKSERDGGLFAFFRDRVMFPVTDRRGQTIAFGARVLPEHVRPLKPGEGKPPKYINSGETALFQKGHILYNESHARTAAARGAPVIVCEGYADVIALWQAGFTGAVAPLGTALTEAQIGVLWSMIPEDPQTGLRAPVLCFDGDAAGQRAATRAMDRILPQLQAGRSARFAFLSDDMDPDDLIRARGPDAFKDVLDRAIPMVDMLWGTLTQGRRFETPESRAGLNRALRESCARIADLSVQKQYQAALGERFYKAYAPQRGRGYGKDGPARDNAVRMRLPDPRARGHRIRAGMALGAVLNYPEIFQDAEETLGRMQIDEPRLDALRQTILSVLGETPELDRAALHDTLRQRGFSEDVHDVLTASHLHGIAAPGQGGDPLLALASLREAVRSGQ